MTRKKLPRPISSDYSGLCLKWLRKTTENMVRIANHWVSFLFLLVIDEIVPSLTWSHSTSLSFKKGISCDCKYCFVKVKVKSCLYITKHHSIKEYWGSWDTTPCIPDLGTRWRWVVSFTTWPLYPQGKSNLYPLDRRLGGPQRRSGRGCPHHMAYILRHSNANRRR
jgi:hypothetical protein